MLTDLEQAGFAPETLQHRHGEVGLNLIDPDGSQHNLWTWMVRSYQRLAGPEARLLENVETALKNGEYALRVDTDGSDSQKATAFKTMLLHTKKTIFYTGLGTISILHAGKNY